MTNEHHKSDLNKDWASVTSLCFGVASIFLFEFSIVPIMAIIFGIIGLGNSGEKKYKALAGLVLGVIFLLVRISQGHIDRSVVNIPSNDNPRQTSTIPTPQTSATIIEQPTSSGSSSIIQSSLISNPLYLQNPSSYLVDDENKILSSPNERTLWVEGVVDPHKLKVSYILDKNGTKILKVETLSIPWLGDPAREFAEIHRGLISNMWLATSVGKCFENGTKDFLQTNFLHTWVFLSATGWDVNGFFGDDYLLKYNDGTTGNNGFSSDLASYIIKNGYGDMELPSNHESALINNSPILKYYTEMKDSESIASLSKRGLWGICK